MAAMLGRRLREILNGAQAGVAAELVPVAAYVLGALRPVAPVVAGRCAVEPPARLLSAAGWIAAAFGAVVAVSLVAGQHDEVVVMPARRTPDSPAPSGD